MDGFGEENGESEDERRKSPMDNEKERKRPVNEENERRKNLIDDDKEGKSPLDNEKETKSPLDDEKETKSPLDDEKGRVTNQRNGEPDKRNAEPSTRSQEEEEEPALNSEDPGQQTMLITSNVNGENDRKENEEMPRAEIPGVGNPLVKNGEAEKAVNFQDLLEIPDDVPMKIFYSQPSEDITSSNVKMKQLRVVLTSQDIVPREKVKAVTEEHNADDDVAEEERMEEDLSQAKDKEELNVVDEKEAALTEKSSDVIMSRLEVLWSECEKELANLVDRISEKIDMEEVEEGDREGGNGAKEEDCEETSVSQEVADLDEPQHVEFNPELIKDAVVRGQSCYVHIKNNCYSSFYGEQLLEQIKKAQTRPKRKRSADDSEEEEGVHVNRKRGAVKYLNRSCDEESESGDVTRILNVKMEKLRDSVSPRGRGRRKSFSSTRGKSEESVSLRRGRSKSVSARSEDLGDLISSRVRQRRKSISMRSEEPENSVRSRGREPENPISSRSRERRKSVSLRDEEPGKSISSRSRKSTPSKVEEPEKSISKRGRGRPRGGNLGKSVSLSSNCREAESRSPKVFSKDSKDSRQVGLEK